MNWIRGVLGAYRLLPRIVWWLLFFQFLVSATHFMAIPLLALHMADRLGFGGVALGTVLSMHLVSARVFPMLTGPLADRFGPRILMLAGLLARALGLFGFAALTDWILLSLSALVMGFGMAAYESAVYGAFARYPPSSATRAFVLSNQALNFGVIVGPALGAGLLELGATYAFGASGVVFLILTCATVRQPRLAIASENHVPVRHSLSALLSDRTSLWLFVVCLPWWFLFSQLYVVFPLHAAQLSGEATGASLVFLVNGLAGSCFVIIGILVFEGLRSITVISLCYAVLVPAYLLAGATQGLGWFLGFVCLYTLAETLILPAIRSTAATLAAPGHESTFQGLQSLSWAVGGSVGFYVGGWFVLNAPTVWWWSLFSLIAAIGCGSTLLFTRKRSLSVAGR